MNILITGGAGFIGSHLAKYHAETGDQIFILDNLAKAAGEPTVFLKRLFEQENVTFFETNLLEPIEIELPRIDLVYHLAAINGTELFYKMPYTVAKTNLLVTTHLLDFLEQNPPGRLVYASTSEVYADGEKQGLVRIPTDETVPVVFTQPTGVRYSYGTSKFMGEFLCFSYGTTFDVPTSVVRYHNIYGPQMGFRHVVSEFIERALSGKQPFKIYGGNETRAFCYIDDAVFATKAVAEMKKCFGEIIHIGNSKEEIKIKDLADLVLQITHSQNETEEQGGRNNSVARRCPDTTKLLELTGFESSTSLAEGLQKTLEWFLSEVKSQ